MYKLLLAFIFFSLSRLTLLFNINMVNVFFSYSTGSLLDVLNVGLSLVPPVKAG